LGIGAAVTPRRRRFRIVRLVVLLVAAVILVTVTLPSVFIAVTCYRPFAPQTLPSADTLRATAGIANYERPGAATFLALPAWDIVYSAEEYAAFVFREPPSRFPWFGAIAQFWRTYAASCRATRHASPFDPGAHLRLGGTGVSFSVQHAVAGAYETTLGRAAEWLGGHDSEEDAWARRTAQEYGRFLHLAPWYEFSFARTLRALWRHTPWAGPHPARKWERRIALSAGYGATAVVARVINRVFGTARVGEDVEIRAWLDDVPDDAFADLRVKRLRTLGPRSCIVGLPRGGAFTAVALELLRHGARFRDIAGNDVIALTAVGSRAARGSVTSPASVVFEEPVLTNPGVVRLAVRVPVGALNEMIAALAARGATLERLYDF
jgi:hypothetical protein